MEFPVWGGTILHAYPHRFGYVQLKKGGNIGLPNKIARVISMPYHTRYTHIPRDMRATPPGIWLLNAPLMNKSSLYFSLMNKLSLSLSLSKLQYSSKKCRVTHHYAPCNCNLLYFVEPYLQQLAFYILYELVLVKLVIVKNLDSCLFIFIMSPRHVDLTNFFFLYHWNLMILIFLGKAL